LKRSKLHKTLNILIRWAIVGASLGFICWKLFAKGSAKDLLQTFESYGNNPFFYKGMVLITILMLLNWSLETFKWQLLVGRIEKISFLPAFQSVLTGLTVSIFTPNRTGEFLGRAFILKQGDPVKASLLSVFGSLSQLLVTTLAGSVSILFIYREFLPNPSEVSAWVNFGILSGIIFFDSALIALYLQVPLFTGITRKFVRNHWKRIRTYLEVIESVSRKELLQIIGLSIARYSVFTFQFYLMLKVFGIVIPFFQALIFIPLIFLSLAVIPTFALSELGVRGSVSLYFIGMYLVKSQAFPLTEAESLSIVLAAGMLWIINLAVPAIAGAPFVFNLRFFRR